MSGYVIRLDLLNKTRAENTVNALRVAATDYCEEHLFSYVPGLLLEVARQIERATSEAAS